MRAVRRNILIAGMLAAVLANLLVFGALSTSLGKLTPRPTRNEVAVETFTPNPYYAKKMTTATATPTLTPTRFPTNPYPTETKLPPNLKHEE